MTHCIVCEVFDCDAPHSYEEIRALELKNCFENPAMPTQAEARDGFRILIAYAKLMERQEKEYASWGCHGFDRVEFQGNDTNRG
jgi:hypothetical protein